jgi:hypothetical protein
LTGAMGAKRPTRDKRSVASVIVMFVFLFKYPS